MVGTRKCSSIFSIVLQLWSWTVVTGTESPTVDAAAADVHVKQHFKNHYAKPANPGRNFMEERVNVIPRFFVAKNADTVIPFADKISQSSKKVLKSLEWTRMEDEGYVREVSNAIFMETAIDALFYRKSISDHAPWRLVDYNSFLRVYGIANTAIKDILVCDRLVFSVVKKRLPSKVKDLAGTNQNPIDLVKSSILRKRYDAVRVDDWVNLIQPHIDLSENSPCTLWFNAKIEEEKGDAIELLLDTMRSKYIPKELSVLEAAAKENKLFTGPIESHKQRVKWKEEEKTPEEVLQLLVPSEPSDPFLEDFIRSTKCVKWIDYVKLIKEDPDVLLVNTFQHHWHFPAIVEQLHFLSFRHLYAKDYSQILYKLNLPFDRKRINAIALGPECHSRLFHISAYGALLRSWKAQSCSAYDVAKLLELNEEDNAVLWIVVWYYTYMDLNEKQAFDDTKLLIKEFRQLRLNLPARWSRSPKQKRMVTVVSQQGDIS